MTDNFLKVDIRVKKKIKLNLFYLYGTALVCEPMCVRTQSGYLCSKRIGANRIRAATGYLRMKQILYNTSWVRQFEFEENLKKKPTNIDVEVSGLPIFDMYRCSHCTALHDHKIRVHTTHYRPPVRVEKKKKNIQVNDNRKISIQRPIQKSFIKKKKKNVFSAQLKIIIY